MREQVLGVYMDDALCRGSLLIAYGAEAMFGDPDFWLVVYHTTGGHTPKSSSNLTCRITCGG